MTNTNLEVEVYRNREAMEAKKVTLKILINAEGIVEPSEVERCLNAIGAKKLVDYFYASVTLDYSNVIFVKDAGGFWHAID